jgi:hypothetical protein
MADLCVGTAVAVGFDRDRPVGERPWVRAMSRPIKIGPRVWFLLAWAASCMLFVGFSLSLHHGVATTQSDSVLCTRN